MMIQKNASNVGIAVARPNIKTILAKGIFRMSAIGLTFLLIAFIATV